MITAASGLLLESGFDGNGGWQFNDLAERVNEEVHSGSWAARVGIPPGGSEIGLSIYSSISREIYLPQDADSFYLQFWTYPIAEGEDAEDFHYVSLRDEEGKLHQLSKLTFNEHAWIERSVSLTPDAGQQVTLYLGAYNDGDDDVASLYVNDVRMIVCR
jgi:hypothetical protein